MTLDSDADEHTGSEHVLRRIIDDWSAAVRRRDYAAVLAHHSPTVLMFDVPPPFLSEGLEAYRKSWDLFFSAMAEPALFDLTDVRITAGAEVAFATAVGRCSYYERPGFATELPFRLTMGFQRQAGRWMIVHEHHSVPAA